MTAHSAAPISRGAKTTGRLLAILLLGCFLRFHALGRLSLWLDEAYTWYLLRPSWSDIWGVMLLISDTSPLYYVVTRLIAPLIGQSEFALRFVAASAGLLALPVVYRAGREMFGRTAGLWACGLLALSPFAVWYARDARPYGFYVLLAALALWGFWRWAERGRPAWPWVLASAALYLTHYASALFVFAQAAYLIMGLRQRPMLFRRWFGWQAVAAAPTSLYLLAFLLRRQPITANTWIPKPGWLALGQTLVNFLSADAQHLTVLGGVLALAAVGVLALALWANKKNRRATCLLVWWLCLPMAATWLLSFRLAAYIDRFFLPEIVAFVLLLGAGLAKIRALESKMTQAAAGAAALVLLGGMALASGRVLTDPAYVKEDWRGAAQVIQVQYAAMPLLAQDGETLLGLLPYWSSGQVAGQALPENLNSATGATVVVLRSLRDTNHGLTKSALFDPLTETALAGWFAAHPQRVRAVYRLAGVGIVVVAP
jgi:mannosyltransferase